ARGRRGITTCAVCLAATTQLGGLGAAIIHWRQGPSLSHPLRGRGRQAIRWPDYDALRQRDAQISETGKTSSSCPWRSVWDGGSARMMAGLGFAALATSSGASAGLLGRRDGKVTRDEALAQARVICDATDLPVSADLEKGFGDAPEVVAETIRLAAEAGLVGCSIEDASGNPAAPIYELGLATERIAAAAAAAPPLPL